MSTVRRRLGRAAPERREDAPPSRTRVGIVLGAGLALIAMAVAVTLSRSPVQIAGTNGVLPKSGLIVTHGSVSGCQSEETLPEGTSGVRLRVAAAIGPSVSVEALSGGRVLTRGARGSGWTGSDVTVPIEQIRHSASHARLCFALGPSNERIAIFGVRTRRAALTLEGERLPGKMRVEYLKIGDGSWWSRALSVARHMGLGHAWSGTWIVLLLAALMSTVVALTSWLIVRELGARRRPATTRAQKSTHPPEAGPRRTAHASAGNWPEQRIAGLGRALRQVPTAAWVCALIACLNAACWSLLTPPFQVPDETDHFAYVQQLAEARHLPELSPVNGSNANSLEEEAGLVGLHQRRVRFTPGIDTISSEAEQQQLQRDLALPVSKRGSGNAGVATSEPPLYYALETIPYDVGRGSTLLTRLELMRLLSALMAGITSLFAFLFVREALPRVSWAWTVGGLGVALAPLLGFISGAVTPDAMLIALSTTLFYCLARAFRHGLTPRLATATGAVIAAGLLTKLNFLGIVPGAILGLVFTTVRAPAQPRLDGRGRTSKRVAYAPLALALAIAASPILLYIGFKGLSDSSSPTLASNSLTSWTQGGSLPHTISYAWQFYLPRLPGMTNYFPGLATTRQLWFNGLVGLYGWSDTVFPSWVDNVALVAAGLVAALCARTLFARRAALKRRVTELIAYSAIAVGVLAPVGATSYVSVISHHEPFWEPRYLLPMLALFGAVLVLAARGAGRRWGPIAGTLIVLVILAHDIFSQLLVISRYYG